MIKFLIYKYYSHQENVSTYQYLNSNNTNNQNSSPSYPLPSEEVSDRDNLICNVSWKICALPCI